MRTPTKFVKGLTDEQQSQLKVIMKSNAPQRKRMRAHAILLSSRRYSIDRIADIYQVDRDRVSQWFEWWAEFEFDGLDDDERGGRPPKLNAEDKKQVQEIVKEEPRSLKRAVSLIAERLEKTISGETLKRVLRDGRHVWKRLRRGLKGRRDEQLFRVGQAELGQMRSRLKSGTSEFELWYFDEAGFSLMPSVPYAWQPIGERIELASSGSGGQRQNVLGFLRWDGADFYAAAFEGRIDSHVVAGCFREFAKEKKSAKPKLIVLDNAPIHRSEEFEEELEELAKCGVYVMFLPSYSPELNFIEMLWKKIKYEWLPMDIYGSFKTMSEGLFEVLKGIGSKYRITFA